MSARSIDQIVIIEHLALDFQKGLTMVMTAKPARYSILTR